MLFNSPVFLLYFLPFTFIGYYILNKRLRLYFLILASLFFYAWDEPKYIFALLFSIVINYIFGLIIDKCSDKKRSTQRTLLFCAISFNLGPLLYYKYLNFALSNINRFFNTGLTIHDIILPLGISFFTFKGISYIIDVYKRRVSVQKNPAALGFYISFFPQLLAGPIVRYKDIEKQIHDGSINYKLIGEGVQRFIVGFSKKILLANNMAVIADRAFSISPAERSVLFAWLGIIAYAFQILFDFSGYSDMAIGLGKMFGLQTDENFNYPYISRSFVEFWRRWHISLSTWFRDYVFSPLSGILVKRKYKKHSIYILSSLAVWFLTGLWHGASWNFIIWGLLHFLLIVLEMLFNIPKRFKKRTAGDMYRFTVLLFILFTFVFFRANDLSSAFIYLLNMFGISNNHFADGNFIFYIREYIVMIVFCVLLSAPVFTRFQERALARGKAFSYIFQSVYAVTLIMLFIISISHLVINTHNPFIYINF